MFGNRLKLPVRCLNLKHNAQEKKSFRYFIILVVNGHCTQMYLMKYGYMDMAGGSGKSAPLLSKDGLRNYIKEFQVCWSLEVKNIFTHNFLTSQMGMIQKKPKATKKS